MATVGEATDEAGPLPASVLPAQIERKHAMTDTKNSADREWGADLRRRGRFGKRKAYRTDEATPSDPLDDPDDVRRFGARVRAKRELAGLSRRKLATMADVSEATIRLIEEGKTAEPTAQTVLALIVVPDLGLNFTDCPPHIRRLGKLGGEDGFQRYQLTGIWYSGARDTYEALLSFLETQPAPSPSEVRALIAKRLATIEALSDDIRPRGDTP